MRSARVQPAAVSRHESEAISQPGADAPWSPAALDALSARFPGREKCRSEVRIVLPGPSRRAGAPMARVHARDSLEKTVRGYEHTCARLESTERTANARRYPPAPASFRGAGASQLFPAPLEKRAPPSDAGTRSVSRAAAPTLTRAFARTSPFRGLEKPRDKPTGR